MSSGWSVRRNPVVGLCGGIASSLCANKKQRPLLFTSISDASLRHILVFPVQAGTHFSHVTGWSYPRAGPVGRCGGIFDDGIAPRRREGGVPASAWVNILPFWHLLLVAEAPAILAQRYGHAIDASADVP